MTAMEGPEQLPLFLVPGALVLVNYYFFWERISSAGRRMFSGPTTFSTLPFTLTRSVWLVIAGLTGAVPIVAAIGFVGSGRLVLDAYSWTGVGIFFAGAITYPWCGAPAAFFCMRDCARCHWRWSVVAGVFRGRAAATTLGFSNPCLFLRRPLGLFCGRFLELLGTLPLLELRLSTTLWWTSACTRFW
jgi:hypothetical protein